MASTEPSVEQVLADLDPTRRQQIQRILYGSAVTPLEVPREAKELATDFCIQVYKHVATSTSDDPKLVRAAVIQNSIVLPTTTPVEQ